MLPRPKKGIPSNGGIKLTPYYQKPETTLVIMRSALEAAILRFFLNKPTFTKIEISVTTFISALLGYLAFPSIDLIDKTKERAVILNAAYQGVYITIGVIALILTIAYIIILCREHEKTKNFTAEALIEAIAGSCEKSDYESPLVTGKELFSVMDKRDVPSSPR